MSPESLSTTMTQPTTKFTIPLNAKDLPEDFPILEGKSNYRRWATEMKGLLQYAGVWGIIDGTKTSDDSPSPAELPHSDFDAINWPVKNLIRVTCTQRVKDLLRDHELASKLLKIQLSLEERVKDVRELIRMICSFP